MKPMNANDNNPATSNAIGTPFIPFGTFTISRYSRILEKRIMANPNPMALAIAKTKALIRVASSIPSARIATPRMAQFVVIKGKNTPRAL